MRKFPPTGARRNLLTRALLGRAVISTFESLEKRTLLSSTDVVIDGVHPIALDLPTIHALLQDSQGNIFYGDDPDGNPGYYDIQGYLDTGTSGVLIDSAFASQSGLAPTT